MHQTNAIQIHADRRVIFETVSNLDNWPRLLPHYRWVKTLKQEADSRIVHMAARRGWIPIQWTSRFWVDAERCELHFRHLTAFTKGMTVVWTLTTTAEAVEVRIDHDLVLSWPLIGPFVAKNIIGRLFIHPVASRTLQSFKAHFEKQPVAQASLPADSSHGTQAGTPVLPKPSQ